MPMRFHGLSITSEEGYIYVRRNGGSESSDCSSMRVNIYTDKGVVKGIFIGRRSRA